MPKGNNNDDDSIFVKHSGNSKPKKGAIILSEDSPKDEVDASKESSIFVNCSVKDSKIVLIVNSTQRPDVAELPSGEDQGDHVTSYAGFIAAIINSSDRFSVEKVPETIRNIAKAVLPNEVDYIDEIDGAETHDRNARKKLTASLSFIELRRQEIEGALKTLKLPADSPLLVSMKAFLEVSDHKEKFRSDLKDGALAKYAQEIESLTKYFLTSVQKEKKTSFPSKGRIDKDSAEGSNADQAINALFAINALHKLISGLESQSYIPKEKLDLIEDFRIASITTKERSEIKIGLKKLYKLKGESDNIATSSRDKISTDIKEIIRKKTNDQQKIGDVKVLAKELLDDLARENVISTLFHTLFDFKYKVEFGKKTKGKDGKEIIKDRRTEERNPKDLCELVSRHIVVMFNALGGITESLSNSKKDSIIKNFIKLTVQNQRWNDCEELGKSEDERVKNVLEQVSIRIKINDGKYQLKNADEIDKAEKELIAKKAAEAKKQPSSKPKPKSATKPLVTGKDKSSGKDA